MCLNSQRPRSRYRHAFVESEPTGTEPVSVAVCSWTVSPIAALAVWVGIRLLTVVPSAGGAEVDRRSHELVRRQCRAVIDTEMAA